MHGHFLFFGVCPCNFRIYRYFRFSCPPPVTIYTPSPRNVSAVCACDTFRFTDQPFSRECKDRAGSCNQIRAAGLFGPHVSAGASPGRYDCRIEAITCSSCTCPADCPVLLQGRETAGFQPSTELTNTPVSSE
ncbi:germ cell-specific protein 1-like protein [Platysternon megacephalum]|uniref:Germ cell-specific protein 1-like protein n=1 Tax=Platysternon megacephalum TaxID=55544 RepID=A0A4D9EJF8_9SAUR|nr:germ cell-specific protein 1-like protein [Platysternon megacephalum]